MFNFRYLLICVGIIATTGTVLPYVSLEKIGMASDGFQEYSRVANKPADKTQTVETLKSLGAEFNQPYKSEKNIECAIWRDDLITSIMLSPLKDLHELHDLRLYRCRITKAAWQEIQVLKIKELYLCGSRLSKSDIKEISKLKGLRLLWLDDTGITDKEVSMLGSLTDLQNLRITKNKLTDKSLDTIKYFTKLKILSLGESDISDAGVRKIQHLTRMTSLNLGSTKITDQTLIEIQGMTELEELLLANTAITDACIPQIKKFKKLRWLDVSYTKMTDAGFERLKSLRLKYLRTQRPLTQEMIDDLIRKQEEYLKKQKEKK